jgi:hypothetical protein
MTIATFQIVRPSFFTRPAFSVSRIAYFNVAEGRQILMHRLFSFRWR